MSIAVLQLGGDPLKQIPAKSSRSSTKSLISSSAQAVVQELESRLMLAFTPTPITQYHVDPLSNGVNSTETLLTPSTVNVNQFGKQFSTPVDGQVYVEPLYVPSLAITSGPLQGVHNVVLVATEHDSLYAINSTGGNVLWKTTLQSVETPGNATGAVTLLNPMGATAIAPEPSGETGSGDLTPEIGITATPTIDLANKAIFVVAKSKQTIGGNTNHYVQILYKINIQSGAILASKVIGDTTYSGGTYTYNTNGNAADTPFVFGSGDGNITVGGKKRIYFNSMREFGRVGLQLFNGTIYMGFASHGDNGPYHGWMLAYDAGTLAIKGALNATPNGGLGGLWQGGGTIGVDPAGDGGNGYFYFETGNGSFNTSVSNFGGIKPGTSSWYIGLPKDADYGDSVVKVALDSTTSPTTQNANGWGLKVVDFFSPFNNAALNGADTDLGSSGLTILPDAVGDNTPDGNNLTSPHLLVASGKEGKVYLIDRDNMSGFDPNTDHVKQVVAGAVSGNLNTPAFFFNNPNPGAGQLPSGTLLMVAGYGGGARAFKISDGTISGPTSSTSNDFGYLPGSPNVSADGITNGILWAINRNTNKLYAYRADNLGVELWDSGQAAANRDLLGTATKFSVPTVADGQVFAGTTNSLVVYGPPVPPTAPPAAPGGLTGTAPSFNRIVLNWTDLSSNEDVFRIERTTTPNDPQSWNEIGTTSANVNTYTDATVLSETAYYYRIRAFNSYLGGSYSGYSNVATVNTPAAPPTGSGDGLQARYYDDNGATSDGHLSNPPTLTRTDPTINFDWGNGSPDAVIPNDDFSVRWNGVIQAPVTGSYTFNLTTDDGDRLYIDNTLVIDDWVDHGPTTDSVSVSFNASSQHSIRVEMYENGGGAVAKLHWTYAGHADSAVTFVGDGATGNYFDDSLNSGAHLQGNPVITRVDPVVDSDTQWPGGDPDGAGNLLGSTKFSVRWTGKVQPQYTETYTFQVLADDGVRLWVNGQLLVNGWITEGKTSYTGDIALSGGQKYDIEMDFFQGAGDIYSQLRWSSPSTPDQIIPQAQLYSGVAPAVPSGLTGTPASGTQVNLTWIDHASNETGYQVERKDPGGSFVVIDTLPADSTSYMDTALVPDTFYQYRVVATNFVDNSPYSNIFNITTPIPPAKPTGSHPTAIAPHSISFSWNDIADNEDGYRISREAAGSTAIVIAQLPRNSTDYIDNGVNPGTSYEYHIQAYNVAGYNDFSGFNISTLTDAPTALTASAGTGEIDLAWTAPAATVDLTYNVYRGTSPGGEDVAPLASGLTSPEYADTSAVPGTTYYYTVTADDSDASNTVFGLSGESAASDEASAALVATPPKVLTAVYSGTTPISVQGLHYFTIAFSDDVKDSLSAEDLIIHNSTDDQDAAPALLQYDAASNTAVVSFDSLADGNYTVTLLSAGITTSAGTPLDGDDDGQPGGDYSFTFFQLAGDLNRDRTVDDTDRQQLQGSFGAAVSPQDGDTDGDHVVDFADLVAVAQNYGKPDTTLARGDVNADGTTNFADLVAVAQHYGKSGQGDLNGDGTIDQADLDILNANFAVTLPPDGTPAPRPAPVATTVPSANTKPVKKPPVVAHAAAAPVTPVSKPSKPSGASLSSTFSTTPIKPAHAAPPTDGRSASLT
jgi:hypothetical protein